MREYTLKLKKGGLDTIIAYIVVILPLLYVLVYMVATIYHFSVQMYMGQVAKEAAVMASTYGKITDAHTNYIYGKLSDVLGTDKDGNVKCEVIYYKKEFLLEDTNGYKAGTVGPLSNPYADGKIPYVEKGDIIGVQIISTEESLLGTVTSFGIFNSAESAYNGKLKYTAYREEIIRNERNT